jgi:hypothetical protein
MPFSPSPRVKAPVKIGLAHAPRRLYPGATAGERGCPDGWKSF